MIQEFKFDNHDEWLAIRHQFLGGSDAGAIIGLNPYKSAYSLWAEKTNRVPGFEGNMATKVGSFLEEFVAKLFEEETGKKVRRKNRTMVNDLYPFACANIDRAVVGENALLEIKTTTSIPIMKQLRNSEEFPIHYYAQVVHYLAVTGLERAYLAVLVNCRELKIYTLERDQAEIDALMDAEALFWDCVTKDIAPSIDGTDSTSDAIASAYPESVADKSVGLDLFDVELQEYIELDNQIKTLTEMRDEKKNIIKEFMKDAESGESDRFKVSYKSQIRKTFDAKRFSSDHPNMDLNDYYKKSSSRPFKVREK